MENKKLELIKIIEEIFNVHQWEIIESDNMTIKIKYNGEFFKEQSNHKKDVYDIFCYFVPKEYDDYNDEELKKLVNRAIENLRKSLDLDKRLEDALYDQSQGKDQMLVKSYDRRFGECVHRRMLDDEIRLLDALMANQREISEQLKKDFYKFFKIE